MKDFISCYLNKHGFEAFSPKAVLFDMDGVLYDSMPMHEVAWTRSMAHYGIDMRPVDAYLYEGSRGVDTIRELVWLQKHERISEEQAEEMYALKSKLYHEQGTAPMMDGMLRLMSSIKSMGLAIGVVTGSAQMKLINRILIDYKDFVSPDHIVTARDVKRGKPNPDPYLEGMRRVGGVDPWQTIVVENAPMGVEAGVRAGAFTIAVNTGILPQSALVEKQPDLYYKAMPLLADDFTTVFEGV